MQQIEQVSEKHGADQVIITVYRAHAGGYTYSLQCALGRMIRAVFPHQIKETYKDPLSAKKAAVSTLLFWAAQSRASKKHLASFGISTCCTQLELGF